MPHSHSHSHSHSHALAGALLRLAAGVTLLATPLAVPASADVLAPGTAGVSVFVRMDWGPAKGRLSRPVVPRPDDTWETLATREAGDAKWAPTIRAMTGREAVVAGKAPVWVPPSGTAFGPKAQWGSAYLDCSKFGRESDVSRTGFQRVDPGAAEISVFGESTFAIFWHEGVEDAARSHAVTRSGTKELFADPKAAGLVLAAPFSVEGSVAATSPLRRVIQSRRVESATKDELRMSLVSEERFDAKGRLLAAGEGTGRLSLLSTAVVAGVGALLVLFAFLARRANKSPSLPA